MEGLLPLIIALAITFVASMNKKKKKSGQERPPHETPWDDMIGDAWKPAKPVRPVQYEDIEAIEELPSLEETQVEAQSLETIDDMNLAVTLRSVQPSAVSEIKFTGQEDSIGDISREEPLHTGENNNKNIFKGDFDARMAIIYSEIMKPKFKEF